MLFSRFSRVDESRQDNNPFQSPGVSLQGLNSADSFAYGKNHGRDTEEGVALDDLGILVKKDFESRVV